MPPGDRSKARSCDRKRRYATSWEAQATAEHRREESGELDLDIYPCPFCHGWHIGHSQPPSKTERT